MRVNRLVLTAILMLCQAQVLSAESTVGRVGKIFDALDKPPAKGKPTPTATYLRLTRLKPAAGADPRLKQAYLLALIQCKKSREALDYATNLVNSHPDYRPVRLVHTRLLLKDRKFDEALAELEATGQQVAEDHVSGELDSQGEASCRLLGLAFGYLEGPGKPLVKSTLGAGVKQRLLKGLSPECVKLFDEQYQMVQIEHRALMANRDKTNDQLMAQNQVVAMEADKQRAKLDEYKQKVEGQAETEKARVRAAWDAANAQYAKAEEAFITIRATLVNLGGQRAMATGQLAMLVKPRVDKNGRMDPRLLNNYNVLANPILGGISLLDQQILRNQNMLLSAWQRGIALEGQLEELAIQGERIGEQFELQKRDFAKEGKKINAVAKTQKPLATRQREQAFATYDDFNLPIEKQRLLASLKPTK